MRLFLSLNPDPSFRSALLKIQEDMKKDGIRAKYTDPSNLHMTLAFIGEYGRPEDILDILERIPFTPVKLVPVSAERHKDLVFLRFGQNSELEEYVTKLRCALAVQNIPFDAKPFLPHITLARRAENTCTAEIPDTVMECGTVSLMHSQFTAAGMVYTEITRV